MGSWGAKLYQDDIAEDVREQFKDLLHRGKTTEEITKQMIDEYSDIIGDPDDGPVFWFALADTQWNLGRLMPEVSERALELLARGCDLAKWHKEDPKLVALREKVLEELQQKLNTKQPPEKKMSQYRLYKCDWKIGDVFAYQLNSEYAKDNNFYQKYIYFVKVQEMQWHPGHIVPRVYFYKKLDDVMSSIDTLNNIAYIPQFYKPIAYENNPNRKKKYLLTLLNTSERVIPKKQLTFLGNIKEVKRVEDEDLNSYEVGWDRFETYMIDNFITWL
jgi:DNA-binding TFAR19-related protein (PDSD5 family)